MALKIFDGNEHLAVDINSGKNAKYKIEIRMVIIEESVFSQNFKMMNVRGTAEDKCRISFLNGQSKTLKQVFRGGFLGDISR